MKEHTVFSQETQARVDHYLGIIKSLLETGLAHVLLHLGSADVAAYTDQEQRAMDEMDKRNHFKTPEIAQPTLG